MDASACPGCSERDARIADLERRVAELEARLKTNATNSSTPPSANPLGADKPVKKKKSKRKRGGQPGHRPHLKQRQGGADFLFEIGDRAQSDRGAVNAATIPATIREHSVGPRLTAALSYLTGNLGLSKRNVEELAADLFGVERILTVAQTCRIRNKNALEYLHAAVHNHRQGLPCPTLLA